MKIKINKHLKHLQPFIDFAITKYKLNRITHIKGYTLDGETRVRVYGQCHKDDSNEYVITVYMGSTGAKHYDPLEITLVTLAHELAHTKHWDHGHKHYRLMCRILNSWWALIRDLNLNPSEGAKQHEDV